MTLLLPQFHIMQLRAAMCVWSASPAFTHRPPTEKPLTCIACCPPPSFVEDSLTDVETGGAESRVERKMDVEHLTCFVPGLLVLGHLWGVDSSGAPLSGHDAMLQESSGRPPSAITMDDLMLAAKLMPGCYNLAKRTPTGLAYDTGRWIQARCPGEHAGPCHTFNPVLEDNRMRPEVIESMYYLWLATGQEVRSCRST